MGYIWLLVAFLVPVLAQGQGAEYILHELEVLSDGLLKDAVTQYSNGNYWRCARDLVVLVDFHPGYSKLDQAEVLLGNALYELGLFDASKGIFKHALKRFPDRPSAAAAIFGLERVAYKTGDYTAALARFEQIQRSGRASRRLLDGARYFAGLSLMELGDYDSAVKTLGGISRNSKYFGYALYAAGLCLLHKREVQKAVEVFERLSALPLVDELDRIVVGEGRLTLGYIYYELGYYKRAVDRFRSVFPDHVKRQDALLGMAWAAYKGGMYDVAVNACTDLVTQFPDTKSLEEALFVLGRSLLELGRYDDAIRVFDHLIDLAPATNAKVGRSARERLAKLEAELEKLRLNLLVLESRILQILPTGTSSDTPSFLKKRLEEIQKQRGKLLDTVRQERDAVASLAEEIQVLRDEFERRENAPNWRAYA
ncbi:MAG: tetratricopeptide repeat protein, partial [Calditrichaeota bacterium]|nr:tetratricopeptide repeat protein [Calditrichota bacterium]